MTLHNLEAEKYLLGCLFLNDETAADEIFENITAKDFDEPKHQVLFATLRLLHDKGVDIDIVTVMDALDKANSLSTAGGADYVISFATLVISTSNRKHYIGIVKSLSKKRQLTRFADYIKNQSATEKSVDELLAEFEKHLTTITMQDLKNDLTPAKDVSNKVYDEIIRSSKGERDPFGLKTGFTLLDKTLWGLHSGNMFVIAARPGVGKTAIALNITHHVAVKNKKTCVFFSFDMPEDEIMSRLYSIASGIDNNAIKSGKGIQEKIKQLDAAKKAIDESGIYIDDTQTLRVEDMLLKLKKIQRTKGLDLVIIDYLQKVRPPRDLKNPVIEIGEVARAIKNMARQLKVPIIALAQPNRQMDKKKADGEVQGVTMSDLRGSGEIEQEADIIAFLQTNSPKDATQKDIIFEMVKSRNSALRNFGLKYIGEIFTFKEINATTTSPSGLLEISPEEAKELGEIF